MTKNNIGVLFDWDGVVLDSAQQHEESWQILAKNRDKNLPPDFFRASFGMRLINILTETLNWVKADDSAAIADIAEEKERLYRDLIERDGVHILPGVTELLQELKNHDIKTCVASSTCRENIDFILQKVSLKDFFDEIVSGDDVTHGKPDPEVFITAARKINCHASDCVVIEDALVGVKASIAAGCKTIAVVYQRDKNDFAMADFLVDDLRSLNVTTIENLFAT